MNKAAFLDRDGTINKDLGYVHRIEDFVYLDGAVDGLRALQDMGFLLVIITNQSGIARGYYKEEDYLDLESWLLSDLRRKGVSIAGSYYCPHHPQGSVAAYRRSCGCRKPGTALFYQAAKDLRIDFSRSIAIGDKPRDLGICQETKAAGILLSQHGGEGTEDVCCCRNWREIVLAAAGLAGRV